MGQIGNPDLNPERHYRAEIGTKTGPASFVAYGRQSPPGAWRLSTSVVNDYTDNFITADRARGQSGVLSSDNSIIYRNVNAEMSGLSLDLQATIAEGLAIRANMAGERGRNLTDDRPLYQMAPFEANLFVDVFGGQGIGSDGAGEWNLGLHSRLIASKHSVDDSTATGSGFDASGPTGAFAIFDVYGGIRVTPGISMVSGIENLADRQYHEYMGFFPLQSGNTAIAAPGRTFYSRVVVSF